MEEEARGGISVLPSLQALLIELAASIETVVLRVAPAHLFQTGDALPHLHGIHHRHAPGI